VLLSSSGEIIGEGTAASGLTVNNGFTQVVLSSGTATNTTAGSGGTELVSSGGLALDTALAGGTLDLTSAAVPSGGIIFTASSSLLEIGDQSALPADALSNFVTATATILPISAISAARRPPC
jgi:autotransporter passenger strand-loop-strand repeat protein